MVLDVPSIQIPPLPKGIRVSYDSTSFWRVQNNSGDGPVEDLLARITKYKRVLKFMSHSIYIDYNSTFISDKSGQRIGLSLPSGDVRLFIKQFRFACAQPPTPRMITFLSELNAIVRKFLPEENPQLATYAWYEGHTHGPCLISASEVAYLPNQSVLTPYPSTDMFNHFKSTLPRKGTFLKKTLQVA